MKPHQGKDAAMLRKRFDRIDANKDGKVDKNELVEARRNRPDRAGKPGDRKPGEGRKGKRPQD
ncbi:hypothetical protein BH23VER1_BH23VER1_09450 [soil metagenome]